MQGTHFLGGRFEDTDFIAATEYRRKQSDAIHKWAQGKSVVLVGDFNREPHESCEVQAFSEGHVKAVEDAQGSYIPSRWEGNRCIDWALTNSPDRVVEVAYAHACYSAA